MPKTQRNLHCIASGTTYEDDGLRNEEPGCASLLRAVYQRKRFTPHADAPGLYRYADWLPIDRQLEGSAAPVSYFSKALASELGLNRLVITFNGYWPERGAFMRTGSFKECEAYSVLARFPIGAGRLVVASAGNTARAFLRAASENGIPLVIVIPEKYLHTLYAVAPVADCIRVIAAGGDSDYFDAIALANKLCELPGFINEGGAKNVARRDGMGTTVLSCAELTGEIPVYYFQAIGSGTGAIAAYEAALRLNESGDVASHAMRLMLSQNTPFTPIADTWPTGSRTWPTLDPDRARGLISQIDATVLSNRNPPYAVAGGLYDALQATGGRVYTAKNEELGKAQALFETLEGCDICPEAGVAVSSLIQAIRLGHVDREQTVMLNITGGGQRNIERDLSPKPVKADVVVPHEVILADLTGAAGMCAEL